MQQTLEITKRELRTLFYSPVGWLVLLIFVLQLGSLLSANLQSRSFRVWMINEDILSLTYNMLFSGGNSIITGMVSNLYLYIPLLTMGLLSREFSDGTIKLLFSSPVKVRDIVFGKYLAVITFALIMVGIVGLFGAILGMFVIDSMDVGLLLWGLLLLYLVICTYSAIGLFISSLTSYQFVAALGVVGVLFGLNYASTMSVDGMPEYLSSMLVWLQGISFIYVFKGFIGSWDLLYFVLMIAMFLTFTYIRIQSLREIKPWWTLAGKYAAATLIVLTIGYVSSQPSMRYYMDVRRAEMLDTRILITRDDVPKWRMIFMQIIPGSMILISSTLIIRRRRR